VVASFALGYLAAVFFHSRVNAQFGTISGPFQITKPPQGEKHRRGFIESAVLKIVTEHPQGMTTAEITAKLGSEGIGRQSIANALGALVQAEKVSSPEGANISLPPPRCRPHPISRAHSSPPEVHSDSPQRFLHLARRRRSCAGSITPSTPSAAGFGPCLVRTSRLSPSEAVHLVDETFSFLNERPRNSSVGDIANCKPRASRKPRFARLQAELARWWFRSGIQRATNPPGDLRVRSQTGCAGSSGISGSGMRHRS
jgi:hypothetical protein